MKRKIAAVALVCGILGSSHAQSDQGWDQGFESAVYEGQNARPTGFDQFRSTAPQNSYSGNQQYSQSAGYQNQGNSSWQQPQPGQQTWQDESWNQRRQAGNRFSQTAPQNFSQPQQTWNQNPAQNYQQAEGQQQYWNQQGSMPSQPVQASSAQNGWSQQQPAYQQPQQQNWAAQQGYAQENYRQPQSYNQPQAAGMNQGNENNYVINNVTGKKMYLSDLGGNQEAPISQSQDFGAQRNQARSYAPSGQQWMSEDLPQQTAYTQNGYNNGQQNYAQAPQAEETPWASRAMEASRGVSTQTEGRQEMPSRKVTSQMRSKTPSQSSAVSRSSGSSRGGFRLPNPFGFLKRLSPF